MGAFLWAAGFGLGGLWADQALVDLGEYPFFAVLQLAVSPLRRVPFSDAKKEPKGLLLRSALAGSGSFAPGSILAQRLRFASLHLLPLCLAAPDGRCAPTPGSIPPLSLPTSPVDQDQEHSSLRSLLSGAASPRAAALLCLCFCRSEPARESVSTANLSLPDSPCPCGSWLASEGGLTADLFLADVLDSNCGSEPARESVFTANPSLPDSPCPCGSWLASEGGLTADCYLADVHDSNCRSEPARDGVSTANLSLPDSPRPCGSWLASEGGLTAGSYLAGYTRSRIVGASLLAKAVYLTPEC